MNGWVNYTVPGASGSWIPAPAFPLLVSEEQVIPPPLVAHPLRNTQTEKILEHRAATTKQMAPKR